MEDFVTFEVAKKLKEKGFSCKYPFAMYDEDGDFCPLFTSCDEDEDSKCIFGNRMYYDYDDFLKYKDAIIAPTISQTLKWLREEKLILIGLSPMQEYDCNEIIEWCCTIFRADKRGGLSWQEEFYYQSYEEAAIAGIEYVLDNLI
jgi:hypothetical protein